VDLADRFNQAFAPFHNGYGGKNFPSYGLHCLALYMLINTRRIIDERTLVQQLDSENRRLAAQEDHEPTSISPSVVNVAQAIVVKKKVRCIKLQRR